MDGSLRTVRCNEFSKDTSSGSRLSCFAPVHREVFSISVTPLTNPLLSCPNGRSHRSLRQCWEQWGQTQLRDSLATVHDMEPFQPQQPAGSPTEPVPVQLRR